MADNNLTLQFKFNQINVFNYMVNYLFNLRSCEDIKPFRLFLHPSGKCNDNCKYCKINVNSETGVDFFKDRSFIDKLIKDVKELGIKDIHMFGGGEPFFYKDNMFYLLEKLKNVDVFTRIITNSNNLDDSDISNIVKNGLVSQLNITLSTDSEEMAGILYKSKERHTRTISVLGSILKYKQLYNKQFPQVDIMFVLSNLNYNKIDRIISIIKKFDINYFFMQPLRINCDDYKELDLSDQEKNEFSARIPEIELFLKEANIMSNINDFKTNKDFIVNSRDYKSVIPETVLFGKHVKIGCYFPLTTIAIHHNGVVPKCYFAPRTFNANYFSISSLREGIINKEHWGFIKDFIGEKCLSNCEACRICVLYEIEEIKKNFVNLNGLN